MTLDFFIAVAIGVVFVFFAVLIVCGYPRWGGRG
jgi:hypothetical protein